LNVGCIPSKSLLHASHKYHDAAKHFKKSGINFDNLSVDVSKMIGQKNKAIKQLTGGIAGLFKANGITHVSGAAATFNADGSINANGEKIEAENTIIAVGSKVSVPPGLDISVIDEVDVVSSTGALDWEHVPESLTVIGGGVIGLEMGSVWSRLGAKLQVVEFAPGILGGISDGAVAASFQKILKKQGFNFNLGCKVTNIEVKKKSSAGGKSLVAVTYEDMATGESKVIESEKVLLSAGRAPNTADIGLEEAFGVKLEGPGRIPVDDNFNVQGSSTAYAIGDCIHGPMLAHKAEEDGHFVAESIFEKMKGEKMAHKTHINFNTVPSVVYTYPEVAWVGKNEEQLNKEGIKYNQSSFPFGANSRAKAMDEGTEGFCKILTDDNDRVLGAHIIAPGAGDLITPFVTSMQFDRPCVELAHTCIAHPSLSEATKEAAMKVSLGKWIHMPN